MTKEDSDLTSLKVYERESAIRFEYIEKRLDDINGLLTKIAFILVTSMGGILISLLLTRI